MYSDIVLTDPEDGGTPWDKLAGGNWVGMVRNQRAVPRRGQVGSKQSPRAEVRRGGGGCYHATGILQRGGNGIAPGGAVL